MSRKAIFWFSLWTSAFSALFYFVYNFLPFGVGWMMFVCLGVFFGMGLKLISLFARMGMNGQASTFLSIVIGTTITMCIHLGPLGNTPLRHMPIIFAGVCLTFSQNGKNILGLVVTFAFGLALCAVCFAGQAVFVKKFPLEQQEPAG